MDPLQERFGAVPESVPRARHAVKEYVRSLGADEACLQSVELAVTEAVSNVARHAYPEASGTFEVSARGDGRREVEIAIRDEGCGPTCVSANPGAGFGIPLMRDVAGEFELIGRPSRGTEVRMRFPLHPPPRKRQVTKPTQVVLANGDDRNE